MGISIHGGTLPGGVTPTCNDCGISLCWDIPRTQYLEAKGFWDEWKCQDCNGSRLSERAWLLENGREALGPDVEAAIVAFCEANPDLETGRDERSNDQVCAVFAEHLTLSGIANGIADAAVVRRTTHRSVSTGDFTIDWTARIHDEDAPTPLVYRTSLGWPITPPTLEQMLESLAEFSNDDPEGFRALLAQVLEGKTKAA